MATGEKARIGAAGEFYAAARLSELGWSVGILPPNTAVHDLLARRDDAASRTQIGVQVKTSVGGAYWGLHVSKHEARRGETDEWFVLVDLDRDRQAPPKLYCVPADIVYVFAWAGWTANAKHDAGATKLNFRDFIAYERRFDLLSRDARSVEWEFSGGLWNWLERVGAPEGIPTRTQRLPPAR